MYPLERLTKLYDGIEQLEDDAWDEVSDGDKSYSDEDEQSWAMDEDEEWSANPPPYNCIPTFSHISGAGTTDTDTQISNDEVDTIEVDEELRSSDNNMADGNEGMDSRMSLSVEPVEGLRAHSSDVPAETEVTESHSDDFLDGIKWKRFEVLSSAPSDHFFYSSPPTQVSRSFLGRLAREHRVLRSSLPGKYKQSLPPTLVLLFKRLHI